MGVLCRDQGSLIELCGRDGWVEQSSEEWRAEGLVLTEWRWALKGNRLGAMDLQNIVLGEGSHWAGGRIARGMAARKWFAPFVVPLLCPFNL